MSQEQDVLLIGIQLFYTGAGDAQRSMYLRIYADGKSRLEQNEWRSGLEGQKQLWPYPDGCSWESLDRGASAGEKISSIEIPKEAAIGILKNEYLEITQRMATLEQEIKHHQESLTSGECYLGRLKAAATVLTGVQS